MSTLISQAVKDEFAQHHVAKSERLLPESKCICGATILSTTLDGSAYGRHIAQEVWKNVDLPLVNSAEELANLVPGSIVINSQGDSLSPKTENAGPDNDEEIFATRGPLRILAGGSKAPTA